MSTLHILPRLMSLHEAVPGRNANAFSGAPIQHEILWKPGILEQIRSFVAESYLSRSGGGDDRGGILFGHFEAGEIEVAAWRPIERKSSGTSHFYLNDQDRKNLHKALASYQRDRELKPLQIVGWFRSRTTGEPQLEEHDIEFHDTFFKDISQFVLIIRPSHQKPAIANLFLRNNTGTFEHGARLTIQPGPCPVEATVDRETQSAKLGFSILRFLTVFTLLGLFCAAWVAALQWHERKTQAEAHPILNFQVLLDGTELQATWDPKLPAVNTAESAQLILGGERLQLSHSELVQGFLRLPLPNALDSDLEISLKVGKIEELAHLVIPAQN